MPPEKSGVHLTSFGNGANQVRMWMPGKWNLESGVIHVLARKVHALLVVWTPLPRVSCVHLQGFFFLVGLANNGNGEM
jgi:hypothetical protein